MKKIAGLIAGLMLFPIGILAQTTPNIGLNLPVYSSPNWNVPLNQNFVILDNYLGGINNFPNPLKASITGGAANLSGGALGAVPYQVSNGITALLGPNTSNTNLYLCEQGNGSAGAAPQWCAGSGSGGVSTFTAPSGGWPSWLVPTVTSPTTTPSLTVAASPIPNAALAYASITINGTGCTLGSTCTVAAAAGTLTGTTLASNVILSSLTSVGTISSGTWQGTPIANSYLAFNYTIVNGQTCVLGSSCTTTSGISTNLAGGAAGSIPYQSAPSSTQMLAPNTTINAFYLCETGTGSAGQPPQWCTGTSGVPATQESTNFSAVCGNTYVGNQSSFGITATLPSITTGCMMTFQDMGTASLTVSNGSTHNIYQSSTTALDAFAVATGETVVMWTDGSNWYATNPIGTTNATEINGGAVPASAAVLATNSSSQIIAAGTTGSGNAVLQTSPSLITPNIGVATGTSLDLPNGGNGIMVEAQGTATSIVNYTSQFMHIGGSYWDGTGPVFDDWYWADAVESGTTPNVILTLTHADLSSVPSVSMPYPLSIGTNTVYRCTTAGTLPIGALTITPADCGASVTTAFSVQ